MHLQYYVLCPVLGRPGANGASLGPPLLRSVIWLMQVGQPVVRVAQGKLQLGVVLDTRASLLLVAVVVPSRIAPGTTVDKSQVKCVLSTQPFENSAERTS